MDYRKILSESKEYLTKLLFHVITDIDSWLILNSGNFQLHILYELKRLYEKESRDINFNKETFTPKAFERITSVSIMENKYSQQQIYKLNKYKDLYIELIYNHTDYVMDYLKNNTFKTLNHNKFLGKYVTLSSESQVKKKLKPNTAEKKRVIQKARELYDKPNNKQQAIRLLSYYDEIRDLELIGNIGERLVQLSQLTERDLTNFTTLFEEPYRLSDKKASTIRKRLEEIKNIFLELRIFDVSNKIDRDIKYILNES